MTLLDDLGNLASKFAGGNAPEAEVHQTYDQVANTVSRETIADGLGHAFKSDRTPPFEQMVSGLFAQSSPDQKAGLLNQLLGSLGPGAASRILNSLGLGGVAGAVAGGSVTPQEAEHVSPEAVQTLAEQAAKKDPTIMDRAAGFYAQHPTLVKAIGAGALALLLSRISSTRR